MNIKQAFAKALREIRKKKRLTQEDFSVVSSRTYLSALERGLKSPTLDKIQNLSAVLGIHPLTLLTLTFYYAEDVGRQSSLIDTILREIGEVAPKPPTML